MTTNEEAATAAAESAKQIIDVTFGADFWLSILTIIAIVIGPVLAVIVTRFVDNLRAAKERKFDIFRTLMRTRKMPVHSDHVGALNLVEVEFIDKTNVITTWKAYLSNLGEQLPPIEDKEKYDVALKKRDSLLTKLIYAIAVSINVSVEQLDILEGNYIPQGWVDDDWEQKLVRRHLLNVLSAKSPIIIRPQNIDQSAYPKKPNDE